MEALAGRTVKNSRENLKKAGDAIGGTGEAIAGGARRPARSIGEAGTSVGTAAKNPGKTASPLYSTIAETAGGPPFNLLELRRNRLSPRKLRRYLFCAAPAGIVQAESLQLYFRGRRNFALQADGAPDAGRRHWCMRQTLRTSVMKNSEPEY